MLAAMDDFLLEAVDHFNTGHPHSHVVIRGKDDRGSDLIIAQDYITAGLRHRAEDLATLELGQETEREVCPASWRPSACPASTGR